MFGRNNVEKAIREGNLDRLRKIVNKNPDVLEKKFAWETPGYLSFNGNIVEMAASYNQPAVIDFLVTEKGVNVDTTLVQKWTPLHVAAHCNKLEAVEKLLSLGANQKLKTDLGYTAYDLAFRDSGIQKLLRPAYEEQKQEEKARAQEKVRKVKEAKAEGTWELSPGSTVEVVHQYEAPVGQYQITDIFNFSTEHLISITKDLSSKQVTPLRQAFKDVSAPEIAQAKAKLNTLNSGSTDTETPAPAAPQRKDAYQYPTASL